MTCSEDERHKVKLKLQTYEISSNGREVLATPRIVLNPDPGSMTEL